MYPASTENELHPFSIDGRTPEVHTGGTNKKARLAKKSIVKATVLKSDSTPSGRLPAFQAGAGCLRDVGVFRLVISDKVGSSMSCKILM